MTHSLLDRFCSDPHDAPITAAAWDPSGARITADDSGFIAITPPGERYPKFMFGMGATVEGAAAVSEGGSLVAVGDNSGTIAVFNTWDGSCVFEDVKEGPAGAARAMRAVAFNPSGTTLACLSIDRIIRVFDVGRWERLANYQGFAGETLQFDDRGERLLAVDNLGQPKLLDLMTHDQIDLERVPGGVRQAYFIDRGRKIVCLGQAGLTLIGLPHGHIETSFNAKGASSLLNITLSPERDQLATVTGRSVHTFDLPDLQHSGKSRHGVERPGNVVLWDSDGVSIATGDGRLHTVGAKPTLPAVLSVSGFGDHRVVAHGDSLAIWQKTRQKRPFKAGASIIESRVDRDGRLIIGLPDDGPVRIYDVRAGRLLFEAEADTAHAVKLAVGGPIACVQLAQGGLRWYDLKANSVFELDWVQGFDLSGSGTFLGAITPSGTVRVLDPTKGEDAMPPPRPHSRADITQISFINRCPNMLTLDTDGVLVTYDLREGVTDQIAVPGRALLDFNVPVDRLWGITGNRYAAVRFQNPDQGTASILYVDIESAEVVHEVPDLLPFAWVDPETGRILQPARGNALLELDRYGTEVRVLRALAHGDWVCITEEGAVDSSSRAPLS